MATPQGQAHARSRLPLTELGGFASWCSWHESGHCGARPSRNWGRVTRGYRVMFGSYALGGTAPTVGIFFRRVDSLPRSQALLGNAGSGALLRYVYNIISGTMVPRASRACKTAFPSGAWERERRGYRFRQLRPRGDGPDCWDHLPSCRLIMAPRGRVCFTMSCCRCSPRGAFCR